MQFFEIQYPAAKEVDILNIAKYVPRNARVPGSFVRDRPGQASPGSEVLIMHSVNLHQAETSYKQDFEACIEEMRKDADCTSFSVTCRPAWAQFVASVDGVDAAKRHLLRVTGWMRNGDRHLGAQSEVVQVFVQAQISLLKVLKADTEVPSMVTFFQVYPLSFQLGQATDIEPTMTDFVEDVESVRHYLGAEKVAVLGHSMGSAIALSHAVAHPERVDRLATSAGASRVSPGAKANWLRTAGQIQAWNENCIRAVVSQVYIEERSLELMPAPAMLINAEDDLLCPPAGSMMLRDQLPHAILVMPKTGGHDCLVFNDEPFERLVRFLLADISMVFAEDPLFVEQLFNPWNLPKDQAFARYYKCGQAFARVESIEAKLKDLRQKVRDREEGDLWSAGSKLQLKEQKDTEQQGEILADIHELEEELFAVLASLGLNKAGEAFGAPRQVLMEQMMRLLERMSVPGREAVQAAGQHWWRSTARKYDEKENTPYMNNKAVAG